MRNIDSKLENFFRTKINDLERELDSDINQYYKYRKQYEESSIILKTISDYFGSLDESEEVLEALRIKKESFDKMKKFDLDIWNKFREKVKYKENIDDL